MGVNKNISILMLFDCVRVNIGLGFHWICNSEKEGGVYVNWWILEKYQHLNTFDTGIANELIHDKN
jgi:hypothetical protein